MEHGPKRVNHLFVFRSPFFRVPFSVSPCPVLPVPFSVSPPYLRRTPHLHRGRVCADAGANSIYLEPDVLLHFPLPLLGKGSQLAERIAPVSR